MPHIGIVVNANMDCTKSVSRHCNNELARAQESCDAGIMSLHGLKKILMLAVDEKQVISL